MLVCNLSTVVPLLFIGWIPDDGADIGEGITVTQHAADEKQRA